MKDIITSTSMKKTLSTYHQSQRERLNSELHLLWNRISVLSVAIVGTFYVAGLQLYNEMGGFPALPEPRKLLFIVTSGVASALSWALCGSVISGSFWVRMNEHKLTLVERELFGASLYSLGTKHKDSSFSQVWSLMTFWRALGCILFCISTLALTGAISYTVNSPQTNLSESCIRDFSALLWAVSSVATLALWWFLYFAPQSRLVWGAVWRRTEDVKLIVDSDEREFISSLDKNRS